MNVTCPRGGMVKDLIHFYTTEILGIFNDAFVMIIEKANLVRLIYKIIATYNPQEYHGDDIFMRVLNARYVFIDIDRKS